MLPSNVVCFAKSFERLPFVVQLLTPEKPFVQNSVTCRLALYLHAEEAAQLMQKYGHVDCDPMTLWVKS